METLAKTIAGAGMSLFFLGIMLFTTEICFQLGASIVLIFSGAGMMFWINDRWDFEKESEV